jgi:hypothetical protein
MTKLSFTILARAEGFEPPSTVLETAILPLNYARNFKVGKLKVFFLLWQLFQAEILKENPLNLRNLKQKLLFQIVNLIKFFLILRILFAS